MNQKVKNLAMLGPASDTFSQWAKILGASGWDVDILPLNGVSLRETCRDHQVIILLPEAEHSASLPALLQHCSDADAAAVLPVLSDPSPGELVDFIRLGVSDVLLRPFSDLELCQTVERVAKRRNLYQQNLAYRQQLERMNKELRESLNILKMDQIAGRQVQKNLLPASPLSFNGYTVAHKIIPSLYLSGDFVAYNLIFDRYILFYIADVSGHGASSAFVTILLRFILKRIIRRHVRNNDVRALARAPEGFVEHVNRQLLATGLEKQITMFAGALDTERNVLRYAVAAQMPMPVIIVDGDARFLPGKGKIIGLFEDAQWEIEEIVLPERFQLAMVSDGLLETLPGEDFQSREAALIEALASSQASHQSMCSALQLDQIKEAADDVSILTICRGGLS